MVELIRGKVGWMIGYLMSMFMILKGLFLVYNKDM